MYEQQRKKGRPLTGTERSLIEHLYKLGFTQTAIAKEVGVWAVPPSAASSVAAWWTS